MTDTVQERFDSFWRDIVMPDGEWDLEQVKKELADYADLLGAVPIVYCHVTGGAVSKPNTTAAAVIGVADEYRQKCEAEAVDDDRDDLKDRGYQIIEPEPESFVRKINGREAILVRSRL